MGQCLSMRLRRAMLSVVDLQRSLRERLGSFAPRLV